MSEIEKMELRINRLRYALMHLILVVERGHSLPSDVLDKFIGVLEQDEAMK